MKVLYLDTSSKFLSLAVADDHQILSQVHQLLDRQRSLQLVPLIDKILKRSRVPLKKLDGFCVGRGPGSFTGLRVGITTIKALAFVLDKPIVAIPSLDILAQNANFLKTKTKQICPLIDAKQNKVYACLYQGQNGKLKRQSEYLLLPIDELLPKLKGEIIFLGDGLALYSEKIKTRKSIQPIFAAEKFWFPNAAQAVSLGLERLQKNKTDDVNSLTPLYLYPKECQIKK